MRDLRGARKSLDSGREAHSSRRSSACNKECTDNRLLHRLDWNPCGKQSATVGTRRCVDASTGGKCLAYVAAARHTHQTRPSLSRRRICCSPQGAAPVLASPAAHARRLVRSSRVLELGSQRTEAGGCLGHRWLTETDSHFGQQRTTLMEAAVIVAVGADLPHRLFDAMTLPVMGQPTVAATWCAPTHVVNQAVHLWSSCGTAPSQSQQQLESIWVPQPRGLSSLPIPRRW